MSDEPMFQRSNHIVGKAAIYDMDLDVLGKHLVTAGQDKNLRSGQHSIRVSINIVLMYMLWVVAPLDCTRSQTANRDQ